MAGDVLVQPIEPLNEGYAGHGLCVAGAYGLSLWTVARDDANFGRRWIGVDHLLDYRIGGFVDG